MYRCIDVFVCGCDCVYNGGLMKYIDIVVYIYIYILLYIYVCVHMCVYIYISC